MSIQSTKLVKASTDLLLFFALEIVDRQFIQRPRYHRGMPRSAIICINYAMGLDCDNDRRTTSMNGLAISPP